MTAFTTGTALGRKKGPASNGADGDIITGLVVPANQVTPSDGGVTAANITVHER